MTEDENSENNSDVEEFFLAFGQLEQTAMPRTTAGQRKAELRTATAAVPGSKSFFKSIKRLRVRLADAMGRNQKQAEKTPGPKIMVKWFRSYFNLDSAESTLKFGTPTKAPLWKLGKILKQVKVWPACLKLKSGKSAGPVTHYLITGKV